MKLETAKRWLILFYEKIQENVAVLAELDSTMGGDGDHGENMLRGMTAVVNAVEPKEFASTVDLFTETGMLLLTKVGGVSGTLYGSAFLGMARAEEADDSLYHDIKEGLVMIQRRGRAEIDDKTMVDVWAPVVEDLKNHQLTPERIDEYILKTALLRAKKGRHAYAADGSLGLVDHGRIGTSFQQIKETVDNNAADTLLGFFDFGSSKMNLEMVGELSEKNILMCKVPLVEGAYTAASLLQAGVPFEAVIEQLREMDIDK